MRCSSKTKTKKNNPLIKIKTDNNLNLNTDKNEKSTFLKILIKLIFQTSCRRRSS